MEKLEIISTCLGTCRNSWKNFTTESKHFLKKADTASFSGNFVRFAAVVLILALMNLVYKPSFTVAMIVFVLAVGNFYYVNRVTPKIEIPGSLSWSLWIFFTAMFVCALFAGHIKSNFAGAFEQFYLAFPFFMILALQSLVDVRREIKFSLAIAALGQFAYMGYDFVVCKIPRPNGFLGNANNSAEMLGLVLPFFVYHFLAAKSSKSRFFWFLVSAADFLALCMTRCRGELIAVVFVALIFIPWFVNRYSQEDVLLAVIADILILSAGYYLFTWRGNSDMHRVYVFTSAFNMWKDHFLVGVGFGEWEAVYNSVYRLKTEVQGLFHAHNMYLMYMSAAGSIGTWAFLNVIYRFLRNFWQNFKENRLYYLVGIAGIVLFLIHGIVDSTFSIRYVTRFTWLMFAIYLTDFSVKGKKAI